MMINLEDYEKELLVRPESYFGVIDDWMDEGFSNGAFGIHRDSDLLEQSNWDCIKEMMQEYIRNDSVRVTTSNHWAVGWVETMHVRIRNRHGEFTRAFRKAVQIKERLDNYPVLDEEDWSRREYDDLMEYLESEVGEENVEACYRWLSDEYNVSCSDDVHYKWIEEWKQLHEDSILDPQMNDNGLTAKD